MAMSIAGHCHGPTIVSGADQDCDDDGCGFSVVKKKPPVDKASESSFPVFPSVGLTGGKVADAKNRKNDYACDYDDYACNYHDDFKREKIPTSPPSKLQHIQNAQ